jgi:hypothetical protein
MKTSCRRELINPLELIESIVDADGMGPTHITFNPELSRHGAAQYDVIRQSKHDGTMLFTIELFQKLLFEIVNKYSYFIPDGEEGVIDRHYELGYIRHSIVFGMMDINGRTMPGQRERLRMPVICTQIRK